MKCKKCGSSNRRGVKFCEQCGAPLAKAAPAKKRVSPVCPSCGFKNRKGVKFCEECGTELGAPAPAEAEAPVPEPEPAAAPPPVIVEVRREKKRRLNPLYLLILLLLLLVCCCGLLLTDTVEVPEFAAPYIEPYLNDMREMFGGFIDADIGGPPQAKDKNCEDFRDQLQKVEHANARENLPNFETDVVKIGNLDNLELWYQWDGDKKRRADCEDKGNFLRCTFPNVAAKGIKYWIKLDGCQEELGSIKWDDEGNEIEHIFKLADPSGECCPGLEVSYTGYINPKVLRLLEIDLACEDGAWNIDEGDSVDGEVFVGEGQTTFWTEVGCKLSDEVLHCESPNTVDQKKSWSKLEMTGDSCSSEVFFQSPYYEQGEPVEEEESCPPGCECSPGSPPYCPDGDSS